MRIKSKNLIAFWLGINLSHSFINCQLSSAADFSRAQHIYAAPSLIHRDLDALGTNNWNLPPVNNSSGVGNAAGNATGDSSAADNPIDSLLSNFGNPASTGSSIGTNWDNGQSSLITSAQYSPSVNKIMTRVNALLAHGKVAEAENLTRAGLKYFPSSPTLKSKFTAITSAEAQTFLTAGYSDLAAKKAREALACNPNAKTAKVVEGKILQTQGLDPNTADGHVRAADALTTEGRLLEAGVEYKLAMNIKPTAAAHVGLGNLALGKGSLVDASRHYEQALALNPQSALAYRQRGALRCVMQDAVGANNDFGKAVALDPNDPVSAEALVGLWKQQVTNNPGVNSHLGLARAYMQTNNLDAARSEYKTVASVDPNNPALPEARRVFKQALGRQQANTSIQAAKTLEGQGAFGEAQQKLDEALALSPDDPQLLMYHGLLSEKLGLYSQAHDNYMSVLRLDPQNINAASRLKAMTQNPSAVIPLTAPPALQMQNMPSVHVNPISPAPPIITPSDPAVTPIPLKSPLPTTKSELPSTNPGFMMRDLYAGRPDPNDQNFSIIDSSDHVDTLANFISSVRAMMLAQKQGLH